MIWIRIFEQGKPINSSVLHDCYMQTLPEVGDAVATGGGDETLYEVKSRVFFINYEESDPQQVALGVAAQKISTYDIAGFG